MQGIKGRRKEIWRREIW